MWMRSRNGKDQIVELWSEAGVVTAHRGFCTAADADGAITTVANGERDGDITTFVPDLDVAVQAFVAENEMRN